MGRLEFVSEWQTVPIKIYWKQLYFYKKALKGIFAIACRASRPTLVSSVTRSDLQHTGYRRTLRKPASQGLCFKKRRPRRPSACGVFELVGRFISGL
jgi:hypothetical protein